MWTAKACRVWDECTDPNSTLVLSDFRDMRSIAAAVVVCSEKGSLSLPKAPTMQNPVSHLSIHQRRKRLGSSAHQKRGKSSLAIDTPIRSLRIRGRWAVGCLANTCSHWRIRRVYEGVHSSKFANVRSFKVERKVVIDQNKLSYCRRALTQLRVNRCSLEYAVIRRWLSGLVVGHVKLFTTLQWRRFGLLSRSDAVSSRFGISTMSDC